MESKSRAGDVPPPGALPSERFSTAIPGRTVGGRVWGLLEPRCASNEEMREYQEPTGVLAPFTDGAGPCDLAAVHTGVFPPVTAVHTRKAVRATS